MTKRVRRRRRAAGVKGTRTLEVELKPLKPTPGVFECLNKLATGGAILG